MSYHDASKTLANITPQRTPKHPYSSTLSTQTAETPTLINTYQAMPDYVSYLNFPVMLVMRGQEGEQMLFSATIRGFRPCSDMQYLIHITHTATGKDHVISSDDVLALYAGEFGRAYMNAEYEDEKLNDKWYGVARSALAWILQDEKLDNSNHALITQFLQPLSIFAHDKYLLARAQLDLMIVLARADRQYCAAERQYVDKMLKEMALQDEDVYTLRLYSLNTLPDTRGIECSAEILGATDVETLKKLVHDAQQLLEVDGVISEQELNLFNTLKQELGMPVQVS